MANAELHERTLNVLVKLVDVLDCEELSLLCWHCGISTDELMPVDHVANHQVDVISGELQF